MSLVSSGSRAHIAGNLVRQQSRQGSILSTGQYDFWTFRPESNPLDQIYSGVSGQRIGATMRMFLLGIFVAYTPSVLLVAWMLWQKGDGGEEPGFDRRM
jgi:hypothetical protein